MDEYRGNVRELRRPAYEIDAIHPAVVTPVVGDDARERQPEPWVLVASRRSLAGADRHVRRFPRAPVAGGLLTYPRIGTREEARVGFSKIAIAIRHRDSVQKALPGLRKEPNSHRRYAEWTIERIGREAAAIGPSTAKLTELILESRPHPEQGYRACIGILRLGRQYGAARLEAACDRGLDIGARSYGSIQSILKHGLDKQPARAARQSELLLDHPNIRGSRYYH